MKKTKNKIHIKQGDIVKIISGKNKGEIGKVTKILRKTQQIIIENINLKIKHIRPKREGEAGQIIKIEGPIHSSNVSLYNKVEE
uniref:Large ribosomal subunit protein uL24c n=1 Tax=Schimmelmannia schousboei TaxID=173468 RepID=A0A1C9C923_9FLOR|nr:ribosomal protein L24 [Schimmelmannia schousboei]AOM64872.1 ribosomal protein L24 [Schimmelmannia schousboei]